MQSRLNLGTTALSVGAIAGAVTRLIGNTYIRNKQSDYLREAVARGNPIVSKMLDEIIGFMDYLSPVSGDNYTDCDGLFRGTVGPSQLVEIEKKHGVLVVWDCQIDKQTKDISTRLVNYTIATAQNDPVTGKRTIAAVQPRDLLVAQVGLKERIILTRIAATKVKNAALKQKEVLQKLAEALDGKHDEVQLRELPFIVTELREAGEALLAANKS